MPPIGSLSLELTANTAVFHQEMGRARESLGQTSRSFGTAEHSAALFAAKGLGAVIPAAQGFEYSIARVVNSALRAGSALRLGGLAAVGVGLGLAAVEGTKKAAEFLALGESVSHFTERMKVAAETQADFFKKLGDNIRTNLVFAQERAKALGAARALGFEATGDTESVIRAQ